MLVVGGGGPSLRIYCLKKIEASASIYEEQCTGLAELEGERVVPRGVQVRVEITSLGNKDILARS